MSTHCKQFPKVREKERNLIPLKQFCPLANKTDFELKFKPIKLLWLIWYPQNSKAVIIQYLIKYGTILYNSLMCWQCIKQDKRSHYM